MINLPIAKSIAFRGAGFYERDAGFIDNIFGSRTYCGDRRATDPDPKVPIGCVLNGLDSDQRRP